MADEYRRYQQRPGGCPPYEKDAAVSEVFNFFWERERVLNIYNLFTKHLQGHDIVHPGERFCRVDVGGRLCAHTVCQLLSL
jgi:hypothetical protein